MNEKDTPKTPRSERLPAPLKKLYFKFIGTRLGGLVYQAYRCLADEGLRRFLYKVARKLKVKLAPTIKIAPKSLSFSSFLRYARLLGSKVFLAKQIKSYDSPTGRKILFISHELDLTGAPIVLRNFAMSALRQGDLPVFLSPNTGKLAKSVVKNDIPLIVYPGAYKTDFIKVFAPLFDLIVVNTIVGAPVINSLAGTKTPVLWWIHEAEHSYHDGLLNQLPADQPGNVNIYCVGDYAARVLQKHRPAYRPGQLLYHTLDAAPSENASPLFQKDQRVTFGLVGTMQKRKGADVLADAIMLLPEETLKKSRFLFIGKAIDTDVMKKIEAACAKYPKAVEYLGEVSNEKLMATYPNLDCLLCPSRDDPMPCSITEALLLSIPTICSENTGYAKIVKETGCGSIYQNDDPALLAQQIQRFAENTDQLASAHTLARKTYEQYFSQEVFDANSQKAIADTLAHTQAKTGRTVSVVIPTYNAGEDAAILLGWLRRQTGLDDLQIIVVDSGSTDNTVQIAKDFGCKIIEISNEVFSHSYARNLGAEAATGEYLLFMTQDAVPSSEKWLATMLDAVQACGASAASCREIPKPDCDLFGRITCYGHNSYIGILDGDRLTQRPANWDNKTVRSDAQLNDVACLIERRVFAQYGYRGNYAEDLDLGLRLLQDCHRLLLMSSAPVIHSHTRAAAYHFKRAIADAILLNEMLPRAFAKNISAQETLDQIGTIALMIFLSIRSLSKVQTEGLHPKKLKRLLWKHYKSAERSAKHLTKESVLKQLNTPWACSDGGMTQVLTDLLAVTDNIRFNASRFYYISAFTANLASDYFLQQNTLPSAQELCQMHVNRMGQALGLLCGEYTITAENENDEFVQLIKKYTQGV